MQLEFLTAILLTAMALCAVATVIVSFLLWKDWKAQKAAPL